MRNGIASSGKGCTMAFCMVVDYTLRDKFGNDVKRLDDARIDKFF